MAVPAAAAAASSSRSSRSRCTWCGGCPQGHACTASAHNSCSAACGSLQRANDGASRPASRCLCWQRTTTAAGQACSSQPCSAAQPSRHSSSGRAHVGCQAAMASACRQSTSLHHHHHHSHHLSAPAFRTSTILYTFCSAPSAICFCRNSTASTVPSAYVLRPTTLCLKTKLTVLSADVRLYV